MLRVLNNRLLKDFVYSLLFLRGISTQDTLKVFTAAPIFLSNMLSGLYGHDHFFVFLYKRYGLKYLCWRTFGCKVILRANCPGDYLVVRPDYEYLIKKYFRPKLGDIVVDVGAHIGVYTLMSSKRVKQKGLVIAIEPDVENFRQLSLNVSLNRIKNVKLIRAAAADVDGNITFFVSKERTGSSIGRVPEELEDKITVPTVKLDTIVNKLALSRIDWLKIDVEGAENLVLKGAYKALEVTKRLIIEVWPDNKKEVFRILRRYGFNVLVISPAHYQSTVNVMAER